MVIAIAAIAALYTALCGTLFVAQRAILFVPPPAPRCLAAAGRASATDGGGAVFRLDGADDRPHDGTVLYFGGNGEDVSCTAPLIARVYPDRSANLVVYPGYLGTAGAPSQATLFHQALAVYDAVAPQSAPVIAVGRSLGSGVALYLASRRPLQRLVLITPYDSIANLAAARFPAFPVRLLSRDPFASYRYAASVHVPVTVIAAGNDEVVPKTSTEHLIASFPPGVVHAVTIDGVGHNTIGDSPRLIEAMARP